MVNAMRDMKKNGYTMIELLVVIVAMGLVTLVTLSATSYAFKDHSGEFYDEKVNGILHQAESYGKTLNTLKEDGNMVITVNDLVKNGYYVGDDEEGNVVDPRNSKANLNGLKIKLTYKEDGTIKASIINDES